MVEVAHPRTRPVGPEYGAEFFMILFGNAEEVGNHQQRERFCVFSQELAVAQRDELVELAVGEFPHEVFVFP